MVYLTILLYFCITSVISFVLLFESNIEYFGDMEPKYENINTLSNFKNLNNIVIPPEKFSDKNLISLYKSVGSGLQIYDDMIGDLLKKRKTYLLYEIDNIIIKKWDIDNIF